MIQSEWLESYRSGESVEVRAGGLAWPPATVVRVNRQRGVVIVRLASGRTTGVRADEIRRPAPAPAPDKAPKDKAPKDKAPKDKAPKDKAPKDKARWRADGPSRKVQTMAPLALSGRVAAFAKSRGCRSEGEAVRMLLEAALEQAGVS